MLRIDREFVKKWSQHYDDRFRGKDDQLEENAVRAFLSNQKEPKYLNKEYFVRLGQWKTKRQRSNYESNDEDTIIEATRSAYQAREPIVKLNILKSLNGVAVAVASTILHYMQPDIFPIFDYHARTTLKEAGHWPRDINDASDQAWLDYLLVMQKLSKQLGVTLRELDKALFAHDKYGRANNSIGKISSNVRAVKTGIRKEVGLKPKRRRKPMALRPETLNYYVEQARAILIGVATERRKISYGELMNKMGGPGRGYIGEVLEEVCRSEHERGNPLLSALVIHSVDKQPGYGFWHIRILPDAIKNASDLEKKIFWERECERVWEGWEIQVP